MLMHIEACHGAEAAATRAAAFLHRYIVNAIDDRGVASLALSGGKTPTAMFRELALADIDWALVHIFQVDERLVAADDERRNVKGVREAFAGSGIPSSHIHGMPVEREALDDGVERYADKLREIAGTPPILDVVHLGLGEDGHTASLFPDDAALEASGEVALSGVHGGVRRMTLTLAAINRARTRVWLVTDRSKRHAVRRLLDSEAGLVANRVRTDNAFLILDADADPSSIG